MKALVPAAIPLALLAAAGAVVGVREVLAAWLAAWWWCLGLVLGCFTNAWIARLSGGAWNAPVRAAALALARAMPWLLLGLLPIAIGLAWLYPWAAQPATAWTAGFPRPHFPAAWLSPPWFLLRLFLYAVLWWWLARPASLAGKGRAAAGLAAHTFLSSLAAVDLLMSLVPGWYSTAFGLVALAGQALAGSALAVFALGEPAPAPGEVPLARDMGNLVLMWTMTWAYLAFMQFLVIWSENLPREIAWYLPRLQTGWRGAGLALVLLQLVLPLLALLMRGLKDKPRRLRAVAALVLAASALNCAWLVFPSVAPHSPHAWWLLPLAFAAAGLPLWALAARGARPGREEVRHAAA